MSNTILKERLTVKILDDRDLEQYLKIENEIKSKSKKLKELGKKIQEDISNGAIVHPKSIYEAYMNEKKIKYSPSYKDLFVKEVGEEKADEILTEDRNQFDKDVKDKKILPKKELVIKKK